MSGNSPALLGDVPAYQRERVLSGMRWSAWLSALAVPCGATINILLARVSPEVLGIYGLLSVYIGLIVTFLYFGGDTVVIRFTPECKTQERASFLASYLAVVMAIFAGWVTLTWMWPEPMRLVLGRDIGERFQMALLCMAPLPIIFFVVVAALKGMLEIRLSQMLAKLLTVISMGAYGILFLFARPALANHPVVIIWGIYFGLTGVLALVGAARIFQLCGRPRLRFHLPAGFWRYSVDTQAVSVLGFFSGRLDYVLLLNFGGLTLLGRYVAVMAVAAIIPMMTRLLMDSLLPSMTNMIASRNTSGAGQVFMIHMRILLLITVAGGSALMLLAAPAAELMGPKYRSVEGLIVLMSLFLSIAAPGGSGGTLLYIVGRQRLAIWTGLLNVVLFGALFIVTWNHWALTGVVVASGAALVVSRAALMMIALRTAPMFPSVVTLWLSGSIIQIAVAAIALWWLPINPLAAIAIWIAALGCFIRIANYDTGEFRQLLGTFVPARWRNAIGRIS